jgi:hypothetical protein
VNSHTLIALMTSVQLVSCGATLNGEPPRRIELPAVELTTHPAEREPSELPGSCVDPWTDALERFAALDPSIDPMDQRALVRRDRLFEPEECTIDLDGDGRDDMALGHAFFGGSGGHEWNLYVMRGNCGHWVGTVDSLAIDTLTTSHNELRDLSLTVQAGTCHWWEHRARFSGHRYRLVFERECRCQVGETGVVNADALQPCGFWGPPADG